MRRERMRARGLLRSADLEVGKKVAAVVAELGLDDVGHEAAEDEGRDEALHREVLVKSAEAVPAMQGRSPVPQSIGVKTDAHGCLHRRELPTYLGSRVDICALASRCCDLVTRAGECRVFFVSLVGADVRLLRVYVECTHASVRACTFPRT